jgi:HEPN domain-containing protein
MSAPDSAPAAWVAKAEHDLLNIENNLAAPRVPRDTVCFHAQQVGEKLLKAFLLSRGRPAPRTHDLVALLAWCAEEDPGLAGCEADCRRLTAYAVGARYPVDLYEPQESEGREMVAAARRLRAELLGRLPP